MERESESGTESKSAHEKTSNMIEKDILIAKATMDLITIFFKVSWSNY